MEQSEPNRNVVTDGQVAVGRTLARAMDREQLITLGGIAFTVLAVVMAGKELTSVWVATFSVGDWWSLTGLSLFIILVAFLIYGGLVYQFTRLGYYRRLAAHVPASIYELDALHEGSAPALAILVPSYCEEESVIEKTLLSAALQDYPGCRIVLLIDNPPNPSSAEDSVALEAARRLPDHINQLLREPLEQFRGAFQTFERRVGEHPFDAHMENALLSDLFDKAATWFELEACSRTLADHSDALFIDKVLAGQAAALRNRATALRSGEISEPESARMLYRRLIALFDAQVTSFERKRYVNLSHEPNKAMNLNSYIGLIGGQFREEQRAGELVLEPVGEDDRAQAWLTVPDCQYVLTLDADSILAPDYASRLIHLMESPEHRRTAVVQTPYSAIPGSTRALERIAGATTDIQYIIHQGFTVYGATFWVGANALLRRCALEDIAVCEVERGHPVTRYIQDRTVIEDTESSVDLVDRGWQLHNYPERLAYSATPPDFGSLLIQRRRWANGGLIILPKLLRYLARGVARRGEGWMRIHYLVSIAAVNVALLSILAFPLTDAVLTLWLPFTAAAYFALYARDLALVGYRVSDVLRVYALNLLLIPVNLGGVLKSLQQAWTRKKIPFGRTPKVTGRTATAPLYLVAVYVLLISWIIGAGFSFADERYAHAAFASFNAVFLLYAILAFVGLRETREDLIAAWRTRFQARRLPVVLPTKPSPAED